MSEAETRLHALLDSLGTHGIAASGPHLDGGGPEWSYLQLLSGRRVYVAQDSNGCWQALIYEGRQLVRLADADGRDWPGDPT